MQEKQGGLTNSNVWQAASRTVWIEFDKLEF